MHDSGFRPYNFSGDMTGHHPDYFDGRLRPYISPNIINVLFSFAIFMIQKVSNNQARLTCHTHFAINFFSCLFASLVSNTFKVEKFHSLVLWKHHNPLDIKEHEVRVNAIHILFFLFSAIAGVSNDDGDGNKNVKKAVG